MRSTDSPNMTRNGKGSPSPSGIRGVQFENGDEGGFLNDQTQRDQRSQGSTAPLVTDSYSGESDIDCF